MIRTTNTALINSYLANDPEFFKVKNPEAFENIYFLYEYKVGLFPGALDGDVMKLHACIDKSARGKSAVEAGRKAIDWVFQNTSAQKIQTKADKSKRHLLAYNAILLARCGEDDKYAYYEVSK